MIYSKNDKTILLLSTSSGPGGAERMISILACSLERLGFRVIVGLFRSGWLKEQCESRGVSVRVLPIRGALGWMWFRDCARLVSQEKISLIHAHEFSAIVYGWVIACLAGLPFVGTIHGKNYFWEKLRRRLAYQLIGRSGRLIAVSEDLRRFVIDKIWLPERNVRVIYNGVHTSPPVNGSEIVTGRRDLCLGDDALVIGAVGSLYQVKGHQYLLDAMPAVLIQHPEAVLLLVGRGDLEDSLKNQAMQLGVDKQVRFLGMRDDIPKLLAIMDVFVLPSLSEGLSLALLESMAAGKPAVATRVGGNVELVVDRETGLLVESKDPGALAAALCTLLGNGAMREEFGQKAAIRVRESFGAQRMADNYQRLYCNLWGAP